MKLRPGVLVRDVNDRTVGIVTAVGDSRFAVRVAGSQVWLLADAIWYAAEHAVKLICASEEIRRYRADDYVDGGGAPAS